MRATTEVTRPSWFWLLAAFVVPFITLLTKIRFINPERLPREGAYVMAVNHYSEIDPLLTAVGIWRLGRAPRFMAKESLFKVPVLGPAMKATGMVPVSRSASASAAKQTLQASEDLVKHGRGVIVYPEGTLTRDPDLWPMRGKTGAVRLALDAGLPIIPVAQWGAQDIMPRYGKLRLFPWRKPSTMLFGEPIDLSAYADRKHEPAALIEATTLVMNRIAELLGEIRGETPPAERWNPAAHNQNETGRYES